MLAVKGVEAGYGAIQVLKGVDLAVKAGEIVTLIGANGAGKSTLLGAISGILAPQNGEIIFKGKNIVRMPPHKIVRQGISLIQEGREIFSEMTVLENLLMGGVSRPAEDSKQTLEAVFQMFPILEQRQHLPGRTLSGGEQQMLAIGRALMAKPILIMMDEPSLGLAPLLVNEVFSRIIELKSEDAAILLVEQNARKALQIADRGYVLENGRIVLKGSGDELYANQKVHEAYLGGKRTRKQTN
ncbi:MAG: ABC transporter ATP-binding protein [Desulfobacterales bacterium]|jgi:branched-chain amino acid transport system ATP-binding protein|nr:ABC transporter ATP-binding protein [Desulfobacterales bacterium]MDP6808499.1 ABC transporter ATP-binding protein [Desulfobacterales bacterium]|tara:strand:- start:35013 stop:35738 length:726 start_codon:yes stop_codon:yes gene_type:complete